MHEHLKRYLNLNITLSGDKLNEIVRHFKPLTVKKNTILLSKGEVCNKLYFVNTGCIRTYYITGQGHEKTRFIAFEGMIATVLNSLISQQPSFEFIDVLENAELLYITRSNFYRLVNEMKEWEK